MRHDEAESFHTMHNARGTTESIISPFAIPRTSKIESNGEAMEASKETGCIGGSRSENPNLVYFTT